MKNKRILFFLITHIDKRVPTNSFDISKNNKDIKFAREKLLDSKTLERRFMDYESKSLFV
jgi:hypothetical protein